MMRVDNKISCCSSFHNKSETNGYRYRVQVGIYRIYNKAMELQMQLMQEGYTSDIERQGELFTVYTGDFSELDNAVMLERFLRLMRYDTMVVAV